MLLLHELRTKEHAGQRILSAGSVDACPGTGRGAAGTRANTNARSL